MSQLSRRSVLFAAGAAALGRSGCSGGDSPSSTDVSGNRADAMSKFGVGDQFEATGPVSISTLYLDNPGYPVKNSWLFW